MIILPAAPPPSRSPGAVVRRRNVDQSMSARDTTLPIGLDRPHSPTVGNVFAFAFVAPADGLQDRSVIELGKEVADLARRHWSGSVP